MEQERVREHSLFFLCTALQSRGNPYHPGDTKTAVAPQQKRVIGQKELVKNPATLVESSVAGFLSSLKQDEGWTKRVGEKCFKPLRYKAFLCLHLP